MMIELYVIAHKEVFIPDSAALIPINPDNATGDNIAEKPGYSELRAHYHVWKNGLPETDFVGFFQFRRYLDLTSAVFTDVGSEKRPLPYRIKKFPMAKSYSEEVLEVLGRYDVIAPMREFTGISVWKRYAAAQGHRVSDLQLAYEIISKKYPEYLTAANNYLNGTGEYYGNIYIMRRDVFKNYCAWLFDILGEYDSRAENIPPRTQGFLAERLFGIWFRKTYSSGSLHCAELPRLHFWGYDDETHHLRKDKLINALLPPGTQLRSVIHKLAK